MFIFLYSEGDQPWDFFGRNGANAETPVLWPPHAKSWLIGKDSDAGREWGQEEKGMIEDEMVGWHHWQDGKKFTCYLSSVQFSSVAQSCPTLCDPMDHSMPGLPVHHQFPEFTQTHIHRVSDAIQPSHPLSSPSPPAPTPSQHQSLFQWVICSHEVAKVLVF